MARIFMTGLEARSMQVFDAYQGAAINTSVKRTGSASLYLGKGNYAQGSLLNNAAEVYVRFGLYATGEMNTVSPGAFFQFLDSAGGAQIFLGLTETSYLVQLRLGGHNGSLLDTSDLALPLNQWVCVEVYAKIADSGGQITVRVDGVEWLSYSGDTQATANANVAIIRFGAASTQGYSTACAYYDDIAVNDTSGARNNSWIGRGGIVGLYPSGAGSHADWDPSAGSNYAAVDEVPHDSDTTYVCTATPDEVDTYAMADLANPDHVVSAVQWLAAARLDEAGSAAIKPVLRQGGTDYAGDSVGLDVGYAYKKKIYDAAPNGDAWTYSIVNAIEAGVKAS